MIIMARLLNGIGLVPALLYNCLLFSWGYDTSLASGSNRLMVERYCSV